MKIEKIYPKGFAANTYFVTADGKNAVVVDPAQPRIFSLLAERALAPAYVLLTHAHFDHVGGVSALQRAGAKVLCSEEEARLIGTQADLCEEFGAPPSDFHSDETFSDGETKSLCGLKVTGDFDARAYRGRNVLSRFGGVENGKRRGQGFVHGRYAL